MVKVVSSVLTVLCLPAGELHVTINAYKAEQEDEISLDMGETIEVIHKLLDGWWVVRYDLHTLTKYIKGLTDCGAKALLELEIICMEG